MLEHVLFKLKVRALPKDLPEQIVVDVSHLELGKAIHLGEIKVPAGVEIIGDKNMPVVAVAMPRTEEEEAAATTAEAVSAGDVEMIKEKKEEGEEGEGRRPRAKRAPPNPAKKRRPKAPRKARQDCRKGRGSGSDKAADKAGEKKPAEKKK